LSAFGSSGQSLIIESEVSIPQCGNDHSRSQICFRFNPPKRLGSSCCIEGAHSLRECLADGSEKRASAALCEIILQISLCARNGIAFVKWSMLE